MRNIYGNCQITALSITLERGFIFSQIDYTQDYVEREVWNYEEIPHINENNLINPEDKLYKLRTFLSKKIYLWKNAIFLVKQYVSIRKWFFGAEEQNETVLPTNYWKNEY